ncbi:unnamed protein product, partial [Rotaria sordida]
MGKYFANKIPDTDISKYAIALGIDNPRDLIACMENTTSNTARQVIRLLYSSDQLLTMTGTEVPKDTRSVIREFAESQKGPLSNLQFIEAVNDVFRSRKSEVKREKKKENRLIASESNNNVHKHIDYQDKSHKSYSHDDKQIVYQIADQLEKNNYRIWLDRNNMYGSATRAMAHAIENSEFVFICMSDSYKQSGFCEMEANYAFQRKRCLIPLIVKGPYRADGWLGLIIANKIYTDFHKYNNFNEAYSKVIQEITRYRNKPTTKISPSINIPTPIVHTIDVKPEAAARTPPMTRTLPPELRLWSTHDVNYFLEINKFEVLLPICAGMDGSTLSGLHIMCQINSYGMYESLKAELARSNATALPIAT